MNHTRVPAGRAKGTAVSAAPRGGTLTGAQMLALPTSPAGPLRAVKHSPSGPRVTSIRHGVPPIRPDPISPAAALAAAPCTFTHDPSWNGLSGVKMATGGV